MSFEIVQICVRPRLLSRAWRSVNQTIEANCCSVRPLNNRELSLLCVSFPLTKCYLLTADGENWRACFSDHNSYTWQNHRHLGTARQSQDNSATPVWPFIWEMVTN
jgi:hypothetical protein